MNFSCHIKGTVKNVLISSAIFSIAAISAAQNISRYVFADVIDSAQQSVVTVEMSGIVTHGMGRSQEIKGSGSGVVIDKAGHIVTNKHVLQGDAVRAGLTVTRRATDISVTFKGNEYIKAELIGVAPDTDLALIKIRENKHISEFKPILIGNSDALRIGEWVVAIGSPFGFSNTNTIGIISAFRRVPLPGTEIFPPHDFIQTDAAINPGNSGGALVNMNGELIGIPTSIFGGGTSTGLGFAIPVNVVTRVVEDLKKGNTAVGSFGVLVQDIRAMGATVRKQLGIIAEAGVAVSAAEPGGPAHQAGLAQGDVIVRINGEAVTDIARFRWLERNAEPGLEAELEVIRKGASSLEVITLIAEEADN